MSVHPTHNEFSPASIGRLGNSASALSLRTEPQNYRAFGRHSHLLWFAKTLSDCEINDIAALPPCSVITPSHVSIHRPVPRNAGSPLARASEPLTRESRATSTTRPPETSTSATKTRPARQVLLGRHSSILVRMATIPHCSHAGNRGALAQGRIPFVLEADLQGQEARLKTTDIEGSSGIDFPDGS